MSGEADTGRIFWLWFGTQFHMLRDLFTDLTAGKATVRTFLLR